MAPAPVPGSHPQTHPQTPRVLNFHDTSIGRDSIDRDFFIEAVVTVVIPIWLGCEVCGVC